MGSKKSKVTESILQTTNNSNTTNDKLMTTYSSLGSNPGGAIHHFEKNLLNNIYNFLPNFFNIFFIQL